MSLRMKLSKQVSRLASVARTVTAASAPSAAPPPAESHVALRDHSETSARAHAVEHVAKPPPEVLHTTAEVAYDWDYAAKRAELRTLYEKSKDLMWNARTDLDWS